MLDVEVEVNELAAELACEGAAEGGLPGGHVAYEEYRRMQCHSRDFMESVSVPRIRSVSGLTAPFRRDGSVS